MIYEKMLRKNIDIYKKYYGQNENRLRYPNEYLIRFYYSYLKQNIRPGGMILDFGYGSGNNSVFFMERGYQVHGIEISGWTQRYVLENVKEKGLDESLMANFKIIDPDWVRLPYEDGMFDFILSNVVLYYYPSEEAIRMVCQDLLRCLKPGGLVFYTMCGTKSSIISDAQPTGKKNIYRVAGKGPRAALDGQYLYLVPDESCLGTLFSIYEKVSTGYIEEELFGRRDFIWIYVGKKGFGSEKEEMHGSEIEACD